MSIHQRNQLLSHILKGKNRRVRVCVCVCVWSKKLLFFSFVLAHDATIERWWNSHDTYDDNCTIISTSFSTQTSKITLPWSTVLVCFPTRVHLLKQNRHTKFIIESLFRSTKMRTANNVKWSPSGWWNLLFLASAYIDEKQTNKRPPAFRDHIETNDERCLTWVCFSFGR